MVTVRTAILGLVLATALTGCRHTHHYVESQTEPAEVATRTFRIEYTARADAPPDAEAAHLWMPLPADTENQQVLSLSVEGSGDHRVERDPDYGNRILHVVRTGPDRPVEVRVKALVRREGYDALSDSVRRNLARPAPLPLFLGENSLVPLNRTVRAEAAALVTDEMSPVQKARVLYDHLTRTFDYDKSVPGYGRGDVVRACDVRKGNCSDVHSLFIALARSVDLPARFVIGFPLPDDPQGEVGGYHCWAEFYAEEHGWVPVDISEAIKAPSRREELFGGLDEDRVQFSMGRDIKLTDDPPPEPRNIFIYPVGRFGETVREEVAWKFAYREVGRQTTVSARPGAGPSLAAAGRAE